MNNFRTLELAIEFYEMVKLLKVQKELKDQLNRAASSIALNLSEGNAKSSANDKRNFFQTAYGSLRECQTILKLANVRDQEVVDRADKLGGFIYRLVNSDIRNSPNWRKPATL